MPAIRTMTATLCLLIAQSAFSQQLDVVKRALNVNSPDNTNAPEQEDTGDLKHLKDGKWIVDSVERDGNTVPGQFGQKPGDIITFDTKNGLTIFG